MEKKYLIIKCEELGDQWECDTDRTVEKKLFSEEEVKQLGSYTGYWESITCNHFKTLEELKKYILEDYKNIEDFLKDMGCETEEEAWEDIIHKDDEPINKFECYEIKNGELIFRKDLSTYKKLED